MEVDVATLERETLELARLQVRVPVGGELRMVKNMSFNEISCHVVFEEEPLISSPCVGCCQQN